MGRTDAYADQLTGESPERLEVPYRFCSDEYSEGTPTCAAFDAGADAAEIGRPDRPLPNYYWFNNFQRDRIFFDEWDYQMRIYWTYFPIKTQFDHWVFGQQDADTWEWMRDDAAAYQIEDVPWARHRRGSSTSAVRDGLAFFQEVLAIPTPGAYTRDFDEGYCGLTIPIHRSSVVTRWNRLLVRRCKHWPRDWALPREHLRRRERLLFL